jgi:hypothetical protein
MPENHDFRGEVNNTVQTTWIPTNPPGPSISYPASNAGNTPSYQDYLWTASVNTPGFASIRPSQLPMHAYGKETKYYKDPLAEFIQTAYVHEGHTYNRYTCNAYFLGSRLDRILWVDYESDDPTQRAVSDLMDKVKRGKAQAAVAMAEAHKTAAHLAHTAQRVAEALLALRRGRFGDFTQALGITVSNVKIKKFYTGLRKAGGKKNQTFRYDKSFGTAKEQQESRYHDFLAKTWLEYNYGWKPLLKDVYDQAEALADTAVATNYEVRVARGRAKTSRYSEVTVPGGQIETRYQIQSTKWFEFNVHYRVPPGAVNPMVAFGMTNPLLVAWELVPFSFVADWFLPIGTAIEALTGYSDLTFSRGTKSVRHLWHNQSQVKSSGLPLTIGGVTYVCESSNCANELTNLGIAREIIGDFPQFGWPKFKDPRSVSHAATAVALLQSLFVHGGTGNLKLR